MIMMCVMWVEGKDDKNSRAGNYDKLFVLPPKLIYLI